MPFPKPTDVSDLTYDDLPVGSRVRVVTDWVDFHPFYGDTGVVEENRGGYLGIIVRLDKPRRIRNPMDREHVQAVFNFNPENLELVEESDDA